MDSWHFQVIQDGMVVVQGEGPADDVQREARHYLFIYGQDGLAEAFIGPGPLPEPEQPDQ